MKKLQVFVSSTFKDLGPERNAAVWEILKTQGIPAGMELFVADGTKSLKIIRRWIDNSDVYFLILGGRYGSIDEKTGKSYTEIEWDYALRRKLPLVAFVASDEYLDAKAKAPGILARDVYERDNVDLYDAFKKKVTQRQREEFSSLAELENSIAHVLSELRDRNDLVGWVRGGTEPAASKITLDTLLKDNRVGALRWSALDRTERAAANDAFKALTPRPEIPVALAASADQQIAAQHEDPIDLSFVNDLFATFLAEQPLTFPLSNAQLAELPQWANRLGLAVAGHEGRAFAGRELDSLDRLYAWLRCESAAYTPADSRDCDVIVVPGSRSDYEYRVDLAAQIAATSGALVVLTGGRPRYERTDGPPVIGEAEAMAKHLEDKNAVVPKYVIETRAQTTSENFLHARAHIRAVALEKGRPANVIIATAPYHGIRAYSLARRAFAEISGSIDHISVALANAKFNRSLMLDGTTRAELVELRQYGLRVYFQEAMKVIGGRAAGEF